MDLLAEVEPIYETLPGWNGNITACKRFDELPKEAQTYVKTLETWWVRPSGSSAWGRIGTQQSYGDSTLFDSFFTS